jgi:2'-5' RNA ligase
MTGENAPSSAVSPDGRRIMVAVVTGEAGDRIQRWRERHDPEQARRLPPHTTLCYWTPDVDLDRLERQVRHAFAGPVEVTLGGVREFDNDQHTFYIDVLDTGALDDARRRLYDSTHVALPGYREWTWHVTCVRESLGHDLDVLRAAAANLRVESRWKVDTVACLELRGDRYEPLATWCVGS